jgi:hypothetical protein
MILLHAMAPRDAAEVGVSELRTHDAGGVAVRYEETAPASDRTALLAHGQRVVALVERVPLLPIRYGTTLPSVDELRAVVTEHADGWRRQLARLAGRSELVVHLDPATRAETTQPDESGPAYLHRRMAQVQRQDRALDDVRALLAPWSVDTCLLTDRRRLAVLVERLDVDAACEAVAEWGLPQPDLDVLVTGPWPPFSFCEEDTLS